MLIENSEKNEVKNFFVAVRNIVTLSTLHIVQHNDVQIRLICTLAYCVVTRKFMFKWIIFLQNVEWATKRIFPSRFACAGCVYVREIRSSIETRPSKLWYCLIFDLLSFKLKFEE